jgi:tetratricopeptide (TPR) repeat protein
MVQNYTNTKYFLYVCVLIYIMTTRIFLFLASFAWFAIQTLPAQTHTSANYIKVGKVKMNNKDYKGAVMELSISLEIEPSAEAYFLRASAKYMLDDVQGSLLDYDNAIALDPYNPIAYNNRGNIKDELKRTADAIKDYTKAISLDALYTSAYYNRGIAHFNVQEYKDAQMDFEKVIKTLPQDAEAMLAIGLCLVKLNKQAEACTWFAKAQPLQPTLADEYLKKHCQ